MKALWISIGHGWDVLRESTHEDNVSTVNRPGASRLHRGAPPACSLAGQNV
jgi:hypothetical protein